MKQTTKRISAKLFIALFAVSITSSLFLTSKAPPLQKSFCKSINNNAFFIAVTSQKNYFSSQLQFTMYFIFIKVFIIYYYKNFFIIVYCSYFLSLNISK